MGVVFDTSGTWTADAEMRAKKISQKVGALCSSGMLAGMLSLTDQVEVVKKAVWDSADAGRAVADTYAAPPFPHGPPAGQHAVVAPGRGGHRSDPPHDG